MFLFLFFLLSILGYSLECPPEQIYLSVYKHNSASSFNQKEESFNIIGVVDSVSQLLVKEKPLGEFRANRTYEYCLTKTKNLVYELVLLDSKGNGWDVDAYVEVRSMTDFLLFKGHCRSGSEELYKIRLTYIISPYQEWGVVAQSISAQEFWLGISNMNVLIDPFDRDWLREDENAADYNHYVTGELSTENLFYNRFILEPEDEFAAVEIGVTNDFMDVMIYLNGIEVYSESNHISNEKNYYRILVNGMYLREGVNIIMVIFDNAEHMNNVYLYGYPSRSLYIPYCEVVDHSEVWEGHDPSLAFDYSSKFFYIVRNDNMFVTFGNDFFDAFEVDEYTIFDYHYAYAWKQWALYAQVNDQWRLLDQRNTSTYSQKFQSFSYTIQGTPMPYHHYRLNILENWGFHLTWFSELFLYVVNPRFEHTLYSFDSVNLNYNINFTIGSSFSEEELKNEVIEFSISPQLPEGVSLDPSTGLISGRFNYDQDELSFFTVTAQGHQHRDVQIIAFQLSEVYCFDSYIDNYRVYYNNYFLETPFILIFIMCGVTFSVLCILVVLLLSYFVYSKL